MCQEEFEPCVKSCWDLVSRGSETMCQEEMWKCVKRNDFIFKRKQSPVSRGSETCAWHSPSHDFSRLPCMHVSNGICTVPTNTGAFQHAGTISRPIALLLGHEVCPQMRHLYPPPLPAVASWGVLHIADSWNSNGGRFRISDLPTMDGYHYSRMRRCTIQHDVGVGGEVLHHLVTPGDRWQDKRKVIDPCHKKQFVYLLWYIYLKATCCLSCSYFHTENIFLPDLT